MFTGIIECEATVENIETNGTSVSFWLSSNIASDLKIDQSVSHNGACLTVEAIENQHYKVTAIAETLQKTNLNTWQIGTKVNTERCMPANGRFDGHFVSGHVDTTAKCVTVLDKTGSWEFTFEINEIFAPNIIEKGSIAINGISLTIFNVTNTTFTVAIIPYTYNNTNINKIIVGTEVNIEFDLIGKFILRKVAIQ
jgi:riboflavin synthase